MARARGGGGGGVGFSVRHAVRVGCWRRFLKHAEGICLRELLTWRFDGCVKLHGHHRVHTLRAQTLRY